MNFAKREHFSPALAATWCETTVEHGVFRDGKQEGTIERRSAWATCPNGHTASLADHEIAADGTVSPSLVCPHERCDFHDFVRLEGWGGNQ